METVRVTNHLPNALCLLAIVTLAVFFSGFNFANVNNSKDNHNGLFSTPADVPIHSNGARDDHFLKPLLHNTYPSVTVSVLTAKQFYGINWRLYMQATPPKPTNLIPTGPITQSKSRPKIASLLQEYSAKVYSAQSHPPSEFKPVNSNPQREGPLPRRRSQYRHRPDSSHNRISEFRQLPQ